ncbi:MAG: hypothetical protein KKB31_07450 [Nanoarchaeota archaeon]|nr:hypothetical protein [Nanoarchaeota archaeon]
MATFASTVEALIDVTYTSQECDLSYMERRERIRGILYTLVYPRQIPPDNYVPGEGE